MKEINNVSLNKMDVNVIIDNFITIESGSLKHDAIKLSLKIFEDIIK